MMGKPTIIPMRGNLFIERLKDRPDSVIQMPAEVSGRVNKARILAVGPDAQNEYEVGDLVLINFWQGTECDLLCLDYEFDKYRIISSDEVLAKYKEG